MIVLTGSTGYIGQQIVKSMSRVQILKDRLNDLGAQNQNPTELSALPKPEKRVTLIHCASSLTIRGSSHANSYEVLTESFAFLEKFASAYPDAHIIYPSSGGSIYKFMNKNPHAETDELSASTLYTQSKLCHEAFLYDLQRRRRNLRVSILRISNPYGSLVSNSRKQGLIGTAVNCLLSGEAFNLFANPATVRDYIHFEDLMSFLNKIVYSERSNDFEILNVGSGRGHSIEEVMAKIEYAFNKKLKINFATDSKNTDETMWSVLDIQKASESYSWIPSVDLDLGISKIASGIGKIP